MRSAADHLAFHEAYQDRLRPVFLHHPERVLAAPPQSASASKDALPRPWETMDPQWRELAAQMSDMGIAPSGSSSPARPAPVSPPHTSAKRPTSPHSNRPHRSAHAETRTGDVAGPRRRRDAPRTDGRSPTPPAPPASRTADVVARLEHLQTHAAHLSKHEVETLLLDIEAHLVRAQDEEDRSVRASRGFRRRAHQLSPTRRAPSPPLTSTTSPSVPRSSSASLSEAQWAVTSDAPSSSQRTEEASAEVANEALATWYRQYVRWRGEYATWYRTYYEAHCQYYNEAPAAPPFLPGEAAAPSRAALPPPRSAARGAAPVHATSQESRRRGTSRGAPPTAHTRHKTPSRMYVGGIDDDEDGDDEGEGEGPVRIESQRTPRRPAPPPPARSASSSRGASTATTRSATFFPHTLRGPSSAASERRPQEFHQSRPAWRH